MNKYSNALKEDAEKSRPAMDGRMTPNLVMEALQDAINYTSDVNGFILHSDLGCQYRSKAYCQLAKQQDFTMSMSVRATVGITRL